MDTSNFQVRLIDSEKGKGLFTTRAFKEGDVIFEEKPIVCCQFSWNAAYGYLACDNCLTPLETAEQNVRRLTSNSSIILPHPECCETKTDLITECEDCGVKYCSVECRTEAYQRYHSTLCLRSREKDDAHPLIQLNETWKQIHYPPETTSVMLLAKMAALVNQADNKAELLSTFSQFCPSTFSETHETTNNWLREKFFGQLDVLRDTMKNAVNTEYTSDWFTPDGFRSMWSVVGRTGQGIGTSAFCRWAKNVYALELPTEEQDHIVELIDRIYDDMEKVVGSFLNNEGSGLYVHQSAINHSCLPNALVEFPYSNSTLVLTVLRDIQPGEEICVSYIDECDLERSRHHRQKRLSHWYSFICRCDKCLSQADDPESASEEEDDDEDYMSN